MEPPGVLLGLYLGPKSWNVFKNDGPGPLGSKGYPHTSFNSGKFSDTYQRFHISVMVNNKKVDSIKLEYLHSFKTAISNPQS